MERQYQPSAQDERTGRFAELADGQQTGTVGELLHYLRHNKKWWLTPIVVVLLLAGLLVVVGSSGAAPFIYTLF